MSKQQDPEKARFWQRTCEAARSGTSIWSRAAAEGV